MKRVAADTQATQGTPGVPPVFHAWEHGELGSMLEGVQKVLHAEQTLVVGEGACFSGRGRSVTGGKSVGVRYAPDPRMLNTRGGLVF